MPFIFNYFFIVLKCCLSIFSIHFIKNFAEFKTSSGFILHTFIKVKIDSSSILDILFPHKAIFILEIFDFVGEELSTLNFKNSSRTFLIMLGV